MMRNAIAGAGIDRAELCGTIEEKNDRRIAGSV